MESWFDESLRDLMDHLVDQSHPSLRGLSTEGATLTHACIVGRGGDCESLHDQIVVLANELGSHLAWEERDLFPLIRDIEGACLRGEPVPAESIDRCRIMIGTAIETNGRLGELAARIHRLDDGLESEMSCHATLMPMMRRLSQELMHELSLENCVLFPRALALGTRSASLQVH